MCPSSVKQTHSQKTSTNKMIHFVNMCRDRIYTAEYITQLSAIIQQIIQAERENIRANRIDTHSTQSAAFHAMYRGWTHDSAEVEAWAIHSGLAY